MPDDTAATAPEPIKTAPSAVTAPAALSETTLSETALAYARQALSPATRRAYGSHCAPGKPVRGKRLGRRPGYPRPGRQSPGRTGRRAGLRHPHQPALRHH